MKTLPAVREATEEENWKQAEQEIPVAAKVLEDEAALIDTVTGLLTGTTKAESR